MQLYCWTSETFLVLERRKPLFPLFITTWFLSTKPLSLVWETWMMGKICISVQLSLHHKNTISAIKDSSSRNHISIFETSSKLLVGVFYSKIISLSSGWGCQKNSHWPQSRVLGGGAVLVTPQSNVKSDPKIGWYWFCCHNWPQS